MVALPALRLIGLVAQHVHASLPSTDPTGCSELASSIAAAVTNREDGTAAVMPAQWPAAVECIASGRWAGFTGGSGGTAASSGARELVSLLANLAHATVADALYHDAGRIGAAVMRTAAAAQIALLATNHASQAISMLRAADQPAEADAVFREAVGLGLGGWENALQRPEFDFH